MQNSGRGGYRAATSVSPVGPNAEPFGPMGGVGGGGGGIEEPLIREARADFEDILAISVGGFPGGGKWGDFFCLDKEWCKCASTTAK